MMTTSWTFLLESLGAVHSHPQHSLLRRRRRRRHRSRLRLYSSRNHNGDCKACPRQRLNLHSQLHPRLLNFHHDRCCSQPDSSCQGEPREAERGRADYKHHRGPEHLTRSLGYTHH